MRTAPRLPAAAALLLLLAAAGGCGKRLPQVVPASGTVRLDGKPLPNALVTFVPLLDQFGAEANSTATTDDQGRFQLVCRHNNQPGAVTGPHVVLVEEPAPPDEVRKAQGGKVVDEYRAKLGNRPIPVKYRAMSDSPLKVEVAAGRDTYDLELQR